MMICSCVGVCVCVQRVRVFVCFVWMCVSVYGFSGGVIFIVLLIFSLVMLNPAANRSKTAPCIKPETRSADAPF